MKVYLKPAEDIGRWLTLILADKKIETGSFPR
jgi:hypothetical protein